MQLQEKLGRLCELEKAQIWLNLVHSVYYDGRRAKSGRTGMKCDLACQFRVTSGRTEKICTIPAPVNLPT